MASETNVGAIRLFLGSLPSSFSLSLASPGRLFDADRPSAPLRGVSGGVVIGTPVTLAELAAAMPGTLPTIREGLVMTPDGAVDDTVTTEDVEFDRAGDAGRMLTKDAVGGGDGAVKELAESRWRCCEPWNGEGGANTDVGVAIGVFWDDEDPMAGIGTDGCLADGTSPL